MDFTEKTTQRLNAVETSLMHLQSDFESLSEVVLENARRIDQLTATLTRLTKRVDEAGEKENPRNPEDEKPPHY